jgi:hypothetical protein
MEIAMDDEHRILEDPVGSSTRPEQNEATEHGPDTMQNLLVGLGHESRGGKRWDEEDRMRSNAGSDTFSLVDADSVAAGLSMQSSHGISSHLGSGSDLASEWDVVSAADEEEALNSYDSDSDAMSQMTKDDCKQLKSFTRDCRACC